MATDDGGCGRCCLGFIFTSGFSALFLWLSLRTRAPKCSIEFFYIPALNQSANLGSNTTVHFNLRLKNQNKDKSVYYDDLNITLFYEPNKTQTQTQGRPLGNITFFGFHQGRDKKTMRVGAVNTSGMNWKSVPTNASAVFRLDLVTRVRYKIIFWKTKRKDLMLGADVEVNKEGSKANPYAITLNSGTAGVGDNYCSPVRALSSLLVLLILFSFL